MVKLKEKTRNIAKAFKAGKSFGYGNLNTSGDTIYHDDFPIIKRLREGRYRIILGENRLSRRIRINSLCEELLIPYMVWSEGNEPVMSWVDDIGERWTYKMLPRDEVFVSTLRSVAPVGAADRTEASFRQRILSRLTVLHRDNLETALALAKNRGDKALAALIEAELRKRGEDNTSTLPLARWS